MNQVKKLLEPESDFFPFLLADWGLLASATQYQQVITQVDVHVLTIQSVLKNTVKHHNLYKHRHKHTQAYP